MIEIAPIPAEKTINVIAGRITYIFVYSGYSGYRSINSEVQKPNNWLPFTLFDIFDVSFFLSPFRLNSAHLHI